jgi:hypothetical protein
MNARTVRVSELAAWVPTNRSDPPAHEAVLAGENRAKAQLHRALLPVLRATGTS